jgi:hypothetical protein
MKIHMFAICVTMNASREKNRSGQRKACCYWLEKRARNQDKSSSAKLGSKLGELHRMMKSKQ